MTSLDKHLDITMLVAFVSILVETSIKCALKSMSNPPSIQEGIPEEPDMTVEEYLKSMKPEKPDMTVEEYLKSMKPDEPDMTVEEYLRSMKPDEPDMTVEEYLKSMKPEEPDMTVEEYLKSMKPEEPDMTVEEYLKSMKPEEPDMTVEEYLKSMKPDEPDMTVEEYLKSMKPEEPDMTVEEYLKSMKPEEPDMTVEEYLKSMKPDEPDMTVEEYLKSMKPEEPDMTVEEYLKSMKPEEPDMTVEEYLKSMKPEEPDMTVEEYLKSMKQEEPDMTVEEYLKSMKQEEPDMTVEEYLTSVKPEEPDMTVEEYLKSMKPEKPDMTVEEYLKSMKPEEPDMTVEEYLKSMKPEEPDMTVEEYLKSMKPEEPDMTVEEYLKSMKPEEPDMTVEEYLKSMKPDEPDMTVEEYLKSMKPEEPDMTVEEYLKSMKPEEPDMTVEEYLKSMKPEEPDMTVEEYLKSMKPEEPDMTVEEYLRSMKPEEPDMTVEEYLKSMKPDEPDMTVEEYLKSMKLEEPDLSLKEYLRSLISHKTPTSGHFELSSDTYSSTCEISRQFFPDEIQFRTVSLLYFGSHEPSINPIGIEKNTGMLTQIVFGSIVSVEDKAVSLACESLDHAVERQYDDYLPLYSMIVESDDSMPSEVIYPHDNELLSHEPCPFAKDFPSPDTQTDIGNIEVITLKEIVLEEISPNHFDSYLWDEEPKVLTNENKSGVVEELYIDDGMKAPADNEFLNLDSYILPDVSDNLPRDMSTCTSLASEHNVVLPEFSHPLRHCTELVIFKRRCDSLPLQVTLLFVDFRKMSPLLRRPQVKSLIAAKEVNKCTSRTEKWREFTTIQCPCLSVLYQEIDTGKQFQLGRIYHEVSIGRLSKRKKDKQNTPLEKQNAPKIDEIIKSIDRRHEKGGRDRMKQLKVPETFSKTYQPRKKELKESDRKGKRRLLEDRWKQTVVKNQKKDEHIGKRYKEIDINTSEVINLEDVIKSSTLEELPSGMKDLKADGKVLDYLQSNHDHLKTNGTVVDEGMKKPESVDELKGDVKSNRSPFRRSRSRQSRDIPRVVLKRTKTLPAHFGSHPNSEDGTETFTDSDDGSVFAITGSPFISPRASFRRPFPKHFSDSECGSMVEASSSQKQPDRDGSSFAITGSYERLEKDLETSGTETVTEDSSSGSGKRRNRGYDSDLSSSETFIDSEDGSTFAITGCHFRRLSSDGSSFAITGSPGLLEFGSNSPSVGSTSEEERLVEKESAFAMTGRRSQSSVASDEGLQGSLHSQKHNQSKKKLATFV